MHYLGIDYGEKRIGLSFGDDELALAYPLPAAVDPDREKRWQHIAAVISQRRVDELVVGYPYNMDGSIGFKAKEVDAFIVELEKRFGLPVHRSDERLTSRAAAEGMAGLRPKGRKKKISPRDRQKRRQSGELDSRAAALILQDYLDSHLPGVPAESGEISGLPPVSWMEAEEAPE